VKSRIFFPVKRSSLPHCITAVYYVPWSQDTEISGVIQVNFHFQVFPYLPKIFYNSESMKSCNVSFLSNESDLPPSPSNHILPALPLDRTLCLITSHHCSKLVALHVVFLVDAGTISNYYFWWLYYRLPCTRVGMQYMYKYHIFWNVI